MFSSVFDIRSKFLQYFIKNGHENVKSSSLVPSNDPTLMFTNSGMVQFKDVFTAKKILPFKRATTAQKSLRAGGKHNDLENVGYTARHHTFFEMLGNFSFGDYFKEEAINFAWEVITKIFGLPASKLLVTVHSSDEDAAKIWKKVSGFDDSKIIRIATHDNFWSMGDTGPCGPCSEIFFDHGDKIQGGLPGSANEDGDRFIEIWNLVFMQYETQNDGTRINLPKPSIDTGMGLERMAAVLQGVHNNYDIDLFKSIISDIKNLTGNDSKEFTYHNNVIADHIRAISFMITEGITPSNEGRGYVLRRIIRRALRHGYMMNINEPFLFKLVDSVKKVMGEYYDELNLCNQTIKQVLKAEEESFMKTIDKGMAILNGEIQKLGTSKIFPASVAYKLYDTFGFPFDLTQDILRSEKKKIDEKEFENIKNQQKEISKKAWSGTGDTFTDKVWFDLASQIHETNFIREKNQIETKVLAIISEKNEIIEKACENQTCFVITENTVCYPQSGGQIGDSGKIYENSKVIAEIVDTQLIEGLIVHKCITKAEVLTKNDLVTIELDKRKRNDCAKNHTATHLLQKALKIVLGEHVAQKGSYVNSEKLRFDFVHNEVISNEQLDEIERIVNESIDNELLVTTTVMNLEDAKKSGAMALFGEKYADVVRVVNIGEIFSKELCGGTHIKNTSSVCGFKILSCSSIGSGLKRIEAKTGKKIIQHIENELLKEKLKNSELQAEIKNLEKKLNAANSKAFADSVEINETRIKDVLIRVSHQKDADQKVVLGLVDLEKNLDNKRILIIGNENSKNQFMSIFIFLSQNFIFDIDLSKFIIYINDTLHLNIKIGNNQSLLRFGEIKPDMFKKLCECISEYVKTLN